MVLTLSVPGLLLPAEIVASTTHGLATPALDLLLGRGETRKSADDWLPRAFGIDRFPAAALRQFGASGTAPGRWICLDPVHWRISHSGITLDDPARLRLDDAESTALIDALRPLFAEWGQLVASSPGQWEIQLDRPLSLATTPLDQALASGIDPGHPGGADGPAWRHLIAEAQLILHAHPVNQCREDTSRPRVSSLWPWGEGGLPDTLSTGFSTMCGTDPVVAGACRLAGCQHAAPPLDFARSPRPLASGATLIMLDSLAGPARALDALAWREALEALERGWFAPALAALRGGGLRELRLLASRLDPAPAWREIRLTRGGIWRVWRHPRALTDWPDWQ